MSSLAPPSSLMPTIVQGPLPKFVVALPGRFTCVVCQNLLKDPWQTECGHRLCLSCMNTLFESAEEVMCPALYEDCVMISRDRMFYDRGTSRDILSQLVYCVYNDAGCPTTVKWSQLKSHVEKCEFEPVECSFKNFGCKEKVPKKKLDEHIIRCSYEPVLCSYCKEKLGKKILEKHVHETCPNMTVDCPYSCGTQMLRKRLEQHRKHCERKPLQCRYHFIGCKYEGGELDVRKHEQNANQDHFELLVIRAEEMDLRRIQLETRIEMTISETDLIKKNLHDANHQINKEENKLKSLLDEIQQLKGNRETLATKVELEENSRHVQEMAATNENQLRHVEDLVERLEQREPFTTGGAMSEDIMRELAATTQQVGVHDIRLAEMDVRFQCLETANYEGVLIWKVTDYTRRRQDAFNGRVLSLYSQPFYINRYGYKMCGRVYLNGDGMGKGTHLSFFFVLMRGEYDALLQWPFRQKVTLSLLDQSPARRDLSDTFRPDPTSSSFRRPTTEMNIASGCPMFISHQNLQNSRFLKDDNIYMKIVVDTTDYVPR